MSLDERIAELAARDRPLAVEILREAVRIPADQVDRPDDEGGDAAAGLSNHERRRLERLHARIIEVGAVRDPGDVGLDEFGNLVWVVDDPDDGVEPADKKVIYLDGHADTVQALRGQWLDKLGGAIDAYDGLVDASVLDRDAVRAQLGYLPPDDEWDQLVFGRGTADQLAGVVSQIIATRIMLELADEGALRGVIVRSYATVAEEDNDGGGPRFLMSTVLPTAGPELVPDAVIFTEGTGDSVNGALGIYRGQRGRMQIEVTVTGRSCHGSMPHLGLNPLEHGGAILAEAAHRAATEGFAEHEFLGAGTRTASWSSTDTPSDCAVPERFTFRFDRRLTLGETPEIALDEVDRLDAVAAARAAGLTVDITVPHYEQPTHTGYVLGNEQVYPGWETPEDHPAIVTAVEAYRRVVGPHIVEPDGGAIAGARRREPRVDRWVFSTDGVGFPVPVDGDIDVPASKRWITSGDLRYPAMFGFGAGVEQNTHRIGEYVDQRELEHAIALIARFPSLFATA